jgi:hypothetical protein
MFLVFSSFEDFDSFEKVLVRYYVGCPSLGIVLLFAHGLWKCWGMTTEMKCHSYPTISRVLLST